MNRLINQLINERMNHGGVYRTAPATPGLLKRVDTLSLKETTYCRKGGTLSLTESLNAERRLF